MMTSPNSSGAGRLESGPYAVPRLFTIPPTASFLDVLARAILDGNLPCVGGQPPDPLALATYTIFLPTRRACRAMREAFLRMTDGEALLLPHIRPLGEVDEEAEFFSGGDLSIAGKEGLEMPPAIGNLERRLAVTQLVLAWSRTMRANSVPGAPGFPATTPAQAVSLATELIRLMDELESERVDLKKKLNDLAPERFAEHWQLTTTFLQIVTEHWPQYLKDRGVTSPYARRDALMAAETERMRNAPPQGPVIAAGSTGSVPATAALLNVVARLPLGAVVLPGLDMNLDDESWSLLSSDHPEHPQFGMAQLLQQLGTDRKDVVPVPGTSPRAGEVARLRLVSETMRPATTTDRWRIYGDSEPEDTLDAALDGITAIEAPTAEDEAETVALLLRQAAEVPGRTATLVTPDRVLARRISARLEKWDIRVDDSAGRPLARTPPGVFLDLIAEVVGNGFSPVSLLALLKHPLARLGRPPAAIRQAARTLELIAFRRPQLASGLAGARGVVERTKATLAENPEKRSVIGRLGEAGCLEAEALLGDLQSAFWPLLQLQNGDAHGVRTFFEAHTKVAEALACDESGDVSHVWRGDAGEALALHFAEILSGSAVDPDITARDYSEFYRSLLRGGVVRPRQAGHPRLSILGPLEARLQRADLVIIAGLNEGTWPRIEDPDPWLSRPMRAAVGLPAPERRVGLAAHDVAQLLSAPQVVVTRAAKVDGVPTVASRWVLRLGALLQGLGKEKAVASEDPWLAWARQRDHIPKYCPISPPEPKPPLVARPRRMSVTRIEEWIANPYAIFARDVLGLEALDPLSGEPDAAHRGQLIHHALHQFTARFPDALPPDSEKELIDIADNLFRALGGHPRVWAFWRPHFARFAKWFGATEADRRHHIAECHSEVRGKLVIDAHAGAFTLTARADRIDLTEDGELVFYDYKTGTPPRRSQVDSLISPQLPLEAAIALRGSYDGLDVKAVSDLRYVHVLGAHDAGSDAQAAGKPVHDLAVEALGELEMLIARFDEIETPYACLRRPDFQGRYRFDDYAHLARVGEWTNSDEQAG